MAQKVDSTVERNLPWNFSVNLIDITFITLAFSIISRETITPLLISNLTDSKIAIGLVPAIYSIAYYLPQLFAANHAERLKRKLPFVMVVGGLLERVPYLFAGLAILLFAEGAPIAALLCIYLVIGLGALGNGVATPAWFSMIGKVLPVNRRGIFFGLSEGLGTLMGIIGAFFVGRVLDDMGYPLNFATLFLVAAVFMGISWIGLALNREPESPIVKEHIPFSHYFRRLPAILRDNHNFRRFLLSYSISRLSTMGVGFFIVYGNENFELSGADVGLLTAILIGSQAAMQLLLGWLADRQGHKANLTISGFALAIAALLALGANDLVGLIPAFVLLGVGLASDHVSRLNIILEFAVPEDQPTFIGLTNTLLAPVVFLAPIFGGWLADAGFDALFTLMIACGAAGSLMLLAWVKEPRNHPPQPIGEIGES
ncbi:MAG: MFS transporter [Chloroflexota bacterium]|nr:MFS transporter [Chloroflexota bacterium]MDE2909589.1 MFS transporter [Chloroflexota bacterium]